MLAVRDYQNLVLARVESLPRHPLHQIVARFAGSEIPGALTRARGLISGPLLAPAVEEAMDQTAEPVDGSVFWGNATLRPSPARSVSSVREIIRCSLSCPMTNWLTMQHGRFRRCWPARWCCCPGSPCHCSPSPTGKAGWRCVRFNRNGNALIFFRHPGHAPAQVPGTNLSETAVVTLPVNHQLQLTGRLAVNGVAQSEPVFDGILYNNGGSEPAVYWFTCKHCPTSRAWITPPR